MARAEKQAAVAEIVESFNDSAAVGLDQPPDPGERELGAEARDVHFDRVGPGLELEPPDLAQQGRAADRLAGPLGQPPEQREFARMQREPALARARIAVEQVERERPRPAQPRELRASSGDASRPLGQLGQPDVRGHRVAEQRRRPKHPAPDNDESLWRRAPSPIQTARANSGVCLPRAR